MLVIGYRGILNVGAVRDSIRKCLEYDNTKALKIAKQIKDGDPVELPNDFILREELEDLDVLVR